MPGDSRLPPSTHAPDDVSIPPITAGPTLTRSFGNPSEQLESMVEEDELGPPDLSRVMTRTGSLLSERRPDIRQALRGRVGPSRLERTRIQRSGASAGSIRAGSGLNREPDSEFFVQEEGVAFDRFTGSRALTPASITQDSRSGRSQIGLGFGSSPLTDAGSPSPNNSVMSLMTASGAHSSSGFAASGRTGRTGASSRANSVMAEVPDYQPEPLLEKYLPGEDNTHNLTFRPKAVSVRDASQFRAERPRVRAEYKYEKPSDLMRVSRIIGNLAKERQAVDSTYVPIGIKQDETQNDQNPIPGPTDEEVWCLCGNQGEAFKIVDSSGRPLPPYDQLSADSKLYEQLKNLMDQLGKVVSSASVRWLFCFEEYERTEAGHFYTECAVERYSSSTTFWRLILRTRS